MVAEVVAEALIDVLIQKNSHSMAGEQGRLRFFQRLQSHLPRNGGKPFQKALHTVSRLDIVE